MKIQVILKEIMTGFWQGGVSLFDIVKLHWLITSVIVFICAYFCSNPKTSLIAWGIIGILALYNAIKAVIEGLNTLKQYFTSDNEEEKKFFIRVLGTKIFDFLLCIVGVLQSLKILGHVAKMSKSAASVISVVDDVAGAIAKSFQYFVK